MIQYNNQINILLWPLQILWSRSVTDYFDVFFTNQSFFYRPTRMYILCTTNLIISYKNQPLFHAPRGWFEEQNRHHQIGK